MSAEPISLPSFGPLLRRYRMAAGLTQEELADRARLSVRTVSDLERGRKLAPRRETVRLLAEALALSPRKRALLEASVRPSALFAQAGTSEAGATPPHNLPAQVELPIGRERETREVVEALTQEGARLLTLTGPGGAGKTRLALQAAEDVLDRFEDGVYAVMLAGLRDPALVPQAIAQALDIRLLPAEPPTEQVRAFLRDKQMLLVLDNLEHLLPASTLLAHLLTGCPRLKLLVTSRVAMRIAGEQEMRVAGLDEEAAVELFVRRAVASRPTFALSAGDERTIAAICGQVDWLPLAIELAAVWVEVLSLPALLERLANRLELLTRGRRDAPERQRTLRDTIAWSEQLLAPEERRLFRRLSVFVGSFTLQAAEAICGDPPGATAGSVLDGLAGLVETSLIQVEHEREGMRFTLLETIREFAQGQLEESGEAEEMRRRHAEYYIQLAQSLAWVRPDQNARDERLGHEMPNLRATLAWARDRGEAGLGLRLATALGLFWYSHGAFEEGGRWLDEFLSAPIPPGEPEAAPRLRVMAMYFLTLLALDQHHYDHAEALARDGLALARQHGDMAGAGNMLTELGHVAEARGELDAAMALFEEGLAAYQASKQPGSVGRVLSSLGNLARTRGEYARARQYLEQTLDWARKRNFSWAVASGLASLGHVACEEGEFVRAGALYRESLEYYQTMRNPSALAWCLEGVVVVMVAHGAYADASGLCGTITSLRQSAGVAPSTSEWPAFAEACDTARHALGEEGFQTANAAGLRLSPERSISAAMAGLVTSEQHQGASNALRRSATHDART